MCLEIYSAEQPIQYPYYQEVIQFDSPISFRADHTFLIRNTGYEIIDKLYVLYTRPLLKFDAASKDVQLLSFKDTTAGVQSTIPGLEKLPGDMLKMTMPNPNNPMCDYPGIEGYWHPKRKKMDLRMPASVFKTKNGDSRAFDAYCVFKANRFSAWTMSLPEPIRPGEAHWLQVSVYVKSAGTVLPTESLLGPCVFQEINSPIDVRRTVIETLQIGARIAKQVGDHEYETLHKDIFDAFGLHKVRHVDYKYYELTIKTGNPREQVLLSSTPHGDIRMRSGSPIPEKVVASDGALYYQPVYMWKSGSMLEPADPWKDTGFTLRLKFRCLESFLKNWREGAAKRSLT